MCRPVPPARTLPLSGLQRLEHFREPCHTHEDDECSRALVSRELHLLALTANSSADDERLGGASLRDGYAGECGSCEHRADTRDDDGLEAVGAEVEYFLTCTAVDSRITLLELQNKSAPKLSDG